MEQNNPNREQALQIFRGILGMKTKDIAANIVINLEQGLANPAYVGVMLKKFEKLKELVHENKEMKQLIEDATKQFQDGTNKTFDVYGATVTLANQGFWDYSNTEDPYLERLIDIQHTVKELIKAREKELQAKADAWSTSNQPKDIVDFGLKAFIVTWDELPKLEWEEGAGEVSTNPPIKGSREVLRYSV